MKQRIPRRRFIRNAALAAGSVTIPACASRGIRVSLQNGSVHKKQPSGKPNVVFLFSDDHACAAIGAYGSKINKTPHIDSIANDGAILENNFCANSICAPSRASILTGKHSHANGHLTNEDVFDGGQVTFPKLMRSAGYRTGIFGKWHLRSEPTGFDEWMVYPGQGNYYNPVYNTPEGEKLFKGYSVELTTDFALKYLERQTGDQPFLLMCQYKAPHRRWLPGPKYFSMYDDVEIPEPDSLFDDYDGRASVVAKHRMGISDHMSMGPDLSYPAEATSDWQRMTPKQREAWKKAYDGKNEKNTPVNLSEKELVRWKYQRYIKNYLRCVAAVDDGVGRVLNYLKTSGLDENTTVVYSSDQGFYLGEHGWFDKRWMFEESLKMPFAVRWPGQIQPGTRIDRLTQNIDFAPSILEACGVDVPAEFQGESFVPLLRGNNPKWRSSIYYHYYEHGGHGVPRHCGVRTDRHKLVHYYSDSEWDLFDLQVDPNEMKSVYDDKRYSAVRSALKKELSALKKKYGVSSEIDRI